ncbi:hypothetical protein D3C71_984870 [compost metagenome]
MHGTALLRQLVDGGDGDRLARLPAARPVGAENQLRTRPVDDLLGRQGVFVTGGDLGLVHLNGRDAQPVLIVSNEGRGAVGQVGGLDHQHRDLVDAARRRADGGVLSVDDLEAALRPRDDGRLEPAPVPALGDPLDQVYRLRRQVALIGRFDQQVARRHPFNKRRRRRDRNEGFGQVDSCDRAKGVALVHVPFCCGF